VDVDWLDFDSPDFDAPDVDSPDVDAPDVDSPDVDAPDVDSPDCAWPDVDAPDCAWAAAFAEGAAADRRSFFAHPVPLKWIVGGANARLTGPSQSGHWWGPASLRPWKASNRWRHVLQT
jgi:hypothetical protein